MAKTNEPNLSTEINTPASEAPVQSGTAVTKTSTESEYTANELANAARTRFNVPSEVVLAALKIAGKDKATFTEAQSLVQTFMKREVK